MEKIREDPFVKKYMANESKCVNCGNDTFQVQRMAPYQFLLVCTECNEPHTIDAHENEETKAPIVTFWSPKMEENSE